MGIEPTYPSEKYGYIIPTSTDAVVTVETFKEKPTVAVAEEYIKAHFGMVVCSLISSPMFWR